MKIYDGFTAQQVSARQRSPLNHAVFARRADEILDLVTHLRGELGLTEALNVVNDRYVDAEPHPELKRFAAVVALARRQALLQNRLDDDRENLHHGNLEHDELVSVGHHYEMLRHEACTYNHMLRGLIETSGQYFSRDDLMRWMISASQGRSQWAKGEVTGAVSEVALHAALQGLPELRGLRYGSLDEDLIGYDFVCEWQGKQLTIDAKTGFYPPLSERKRGHRHLEISVPREVVKEFQVTRRGLDMLRKDVKSALAHGEETPQERVPEHHFSPVQAY